MWQREEWIRIILSSFQKKASVFSSLKMYTHYSFKFQSGLFSNCKWVHLFPPKEWIANICFNLNCIIWKIVEISNYLYTYYKYKSYAITSNTLMNLYDLPNMFCKVFIQLIINRMKLHVRKPNVIKTFLEFGKSCILQK